MVKTASGKNVILKVMPQSIGDELHVSSTMYSQEIFLFIDF